MGSYIPLADYWANYYGVPTNIFEALIQSESSWNPAALSNKGAIGLGQVMPSTGRELGFSAQQLKDPSSNLQASAKYFSQQQASFQNWEQAIQAYKAGPQNVVNQTVPADYQSNSKATLQAGVGTSLLSSDVVDNTQMRNATNTPIAQGFSVGKNTATKIKNTITDPLKNLGNKAKAAITQAWSPTAYGLVFVAGGIALIIVSVAKLRN